MVYTASPGSSGTAAIPVAAARNSAGCAGVCQPQRGRLLMRVLLGIVLGPCSPSGPPYITTPTTHDSHNALASLNEPNAIPRPLVNWEVVGHKWQRLTERARLEWSRLAS